MPFEGDIADFTRIPFPIVETPAQRVIRQARELIADRRRWVRTWQSGEAFCILGALRHAHHGNAWTPGTGGAQDYVLRVLRRRGYTGITTFNDNHASHVDAVAVLDLAYELAGKPSGAKLDTSRIPRKGVRVARDLLTGEPLPPPQVFYATPRRLSVAEIVESLAGARAMETPPPRPRAFAGALDLPLLRMLSGVVRGAL